MAAKEPDTKGSAFEAPTLIRSTPGRLLSFLRSLPRRSLSVGHLVVAPLLLVVIGLFFQVAHLKQQLEEVLGPRPNLFVMNLEPVDGAATRDAEEFTATTVPAGMENVVFLLVQEDFSPVDDHAVEIRDAVGQVFWQHRGMRSLPEGGFSLEVPLDSLASNLVEIRLYGLDGQDRKLSNPPRARSC
ncbi:MAG: hypothetical protein GY856_21970 [bacterium]|nr:hypothetical protein [bacterium]